MTQSLATTAPVEQEVRWRWKGFLPRSFLFSLEIWKDQTNLVEVPLPVGKLAVSPDYCWQVASREDSFIVLIGHCIDLRAPGRKEAEVANRLLDTALQRGVDEMLSETDDFIGRYTAICCIRGAWIAFNDAGATRSTYYAEDAAIVASHSTIIGEVLGQEPRRQLFRHYRFGLPGNATLVPGVRLLLANFALDLQRRKLFRFWPRAERIERPLQELTDPVERTWVQTADAIASRWTPAIALTAGLDSRVSLAAFRHIPEKVVFTYDRGEEDKIEVEVATELCRRLGIGHRRILPVDRDKARSIYAALEAMPDHRHIDEAPAMYLSAFPGERYINVRSNLSEIGRAVWRQRHMVSTRFDPSDWIDIVAHADRRGEPLRREAIQYLREELDRFFDLAGYDRSNPQDPQLLGYDAWDLTYWEHRMSTWHGPVMLGSDFAFDTMIVFNSRRVLKLLLSAPREARIKATLYREFIARRCSEIRDVPINPKAGRDWQHLLPIRQAYRQVRRRITILKRVDRAIRTIARPR